MKIKNVEAIFPLSPVQEEILHASSNGSATTNCSQVVFNLRGDLDVSRFERAWREQIDLHSILRSSFAWKRVKQPVQLINKSLNFALAEEDWRELPEFEQQSRLEDFLVSDRERGFDPSVPPLIRVTLFRTQDNLWALVLSYHSILFDAQSLPSILRNVFTAYDGMNNGDVRQLAAIRPHKDYVSWMKDQKPSESRAYWQRLFEDFNTPNQISLAVPEPDGPGHQERFDKYTRELSSLIDLDAWARKNGFRVQTVIEAAWSILLSLYGGQRDVVFGLTLSGRPDSLRGDGALVGAFTNTIPLRVLIKPDTGALSFLHQVERLHHDAQHFDYTSASRILEWTNLDAGIPLFDTCLNFDNHIVDQCASIQSKSLALQNFRLIEKTPSPLNINVHLGSRLVVDAVYSAKKYDSEMISQMLGHLENLIAGIMDHPERELAAVEMIGEEERRVLLEEWNETAVEYPRERSVAELFEEVVVSQPHAIAVEYEGEQLSYEQLNSRANQLAHYLRSKGVGPEVAVGIMLDRSLELIVGLVAILKAGGAYVPLDPQYPEPRLTFMLADSGARVVITQSKYANVIPDSTAEFVVIDEHSDQIAAQSEQDLPSSASGLNLAYITYTSGSTGQPKGVSVEHRAIVRLVRGANYAELSPQQVMLQYAPVSFDASTFDIWGALLNGGKLVVMRAGEVTLRELGRTITQRGVTTLFLTSALFHQMVDEEAESLAVLKQVITGGDVISPTHIDKALARQHEGVVVSAYGPTENTTFSTCELMRGRRPNGRRVPLGVPISNSTAYVLNERMEPVPVGVCAELYVGGEGLARGYAGRADQTAERFVPHPYAKQPGERLYRTGDEVRRRRDGKLEFIGRSDQQVKVRGFRIELGEIERVLAQHAAVEEAVVVMKQSQTGDKRLVGYVVLSGGQEIGGDINRELREHVRRELPEYMVPAAVVVLERMPVTANGKLDRAALPEPYEGHEDKVVVGPRTAEEELLLDIWKQLLGVEQISIDDDFFTLGGHSLLATQVMARIRQVFQVELGLQVLFEEPTIAGLSSAIQSQLRQGQVSVKPELKRAERGAVVELSYAQQRLWFSEQMGEGSTFYNVPVGLRLRGELDVYALARTLNEIVRRHETLRTRIELIGTQPYQVIDEQVELRLAVIDHSELDQQSKAAAGERVKRQEASAGFNLSTGPVIRAKLIEQDAQDHVLLVTMHHIVSDGWSMGVLVREVSALYEAYRRGEESPLTELPVQYADYALWQREWLQGEVLDEQLKYWEEKLAGAPVQIELPTDRPRAAFRAGGGRAGQVRVEFDEELTRSVKEESRKQALTVYMLLMGALGVLLTRYSRSSEVVIGSPIANRVVAEVEDLIGFFVNTLALRMRVDEEETVEELLKRVREEVLGAYAHQDVPYEKVVERVQMKRAGEAGGLFQVDLTVQNAPRGEIRMEGLEIAAESVRNERAKLDLTIVIGEEGGKLLGGVEYNADLYDTESVQRMMRHLEELLRGVVAGEGKRVRELELMSAAERRQVLEEWNETAVEYPRERSLAELFEEVVVSQPHAIAVVYEGEQLSYEQLNRRANQLAHYLRSRGVGPEVAVGITLDRSLDLIVGLVAILKAGGAYVPLDLSYPLERLAFMLQDAGIGILVTTETQLDLLPARWAQTICLDTDAEMIASLSEENLASEVSAENLAYVMYTSGSTGQPKGVSVEQRAVTRLVRGANYVALGPEEVLLQYAPVSFDASTFEVWGALLNGGKLVVMRAGEVTLRELGQTLTEQAVTTLWLTSALFNQMVDEEVSSLAGVRQLIAGGDVLSPAHVNKVLQLQQQGAVINGYGPTENTTFSTCEVMSGRRVEGGRGVPIGLPISNSTAYVLNERMEPVPVGVCAELYVGGEGLARGYAGRADQTAERFVPHPYAKQPGERLYRTGDEVRRRRDGKLEFIGRSDQQVKVRGFRIELGEIERVLAQHAAVEEAAVVMKQSQTGDKRLVGYVVLSGGQEIGGDVNRELREHVRRALPEYMVPAGLVVLERMPVTANGKLDRAALPELDESRIGAAEYENPRTPVEEVLAGIWAELLELESVSIHADFFDLGGHSLLVMRLNAWIRDAFGVEVTVGELFESPTLIAMAAIVEQRLRSGQRLQMPPLERVVDHQTAPLSYAQQRLWFLQNLHPEDTSYNMPFGLKLNGPLDIGALGQAFSEIVRRHETLRTRFLAADGGAIQVVQPAREWHLPLIDLTGLGESQQQAETKALTRREAGRIFDLASDELLHTVLLRRSPEDHLLLVTMHHIVSDGWSMGVLVNEVSVLYEAYRRGEESPLAELPVQYADYARWQREWLQGEVLDEQLKYWEEKLAGAPAQVELPTDRPRAAVKAGRAGQVRVEFDEELTRSVKQESRKQALTVYMLLMGALGVLLTRYSRSQEVVIGSPIANRAVTEVEGLIGFFVNTLALRVRVDEEETVEELLKRVREEVLGAYAHRDVPYEKVVERVQVERAGEAGGLFQVVLAVQNAPRGEIRMEGLELAAESVGTDRAKFELTIGLGENGGRLIGGVEYNAELYEAESVRRMMRHLEELLRGVVAGEGKRVRELELMSAAERRQVLEEWNETAVEYPRERSVAELFEEIVISQPHAIAVEYEGAQLSYEQLNRRANQLAHYLRSRGVGPEVAVGIMLDRSLELIVGLVAILKAGGAYVPLDPQYPEPRLAFMLADSGARVVITQSKYANVIPDSTAEFVLTDEHSDQIAAQSEQNLASSASGLNLAYITYTSGSTGQPKGVSVAHRAIVRLVRGANYAELSPEQVMLQYAPVSFDASTFDIWGALLNGGKLVVMRAGEVTLRELGRTITQRGVTTLFLTSALFHQMVDEEAESLAVLKQVITGGDVISPTHIDKALARQHEGVVVSAYGPTENTTFSTCEVMRGRRPNGRRVPLGQPISNSTAYVLNERMEPVPVGVCAELYVGGEGLARGYAGRADQTAERFVPHPYAKQPGERLYRTGDEVRRRRDGKLEFIGRSDQQVKVRGFRIELGEIERVLAQHAAVEEAVVVMKQSQTGDKRLVGYVVLSGAQEIDGDINRELIEHVRRELPEYMVPAAIVVLERLPVTANGKLDRAALPELDESQIGATEDENPRTPVEEVLAGIWAELLDVESVSIHADFFELGGHSLLAMRLNAWIRNAFGVEVTIGELFASPTLTAMAAIVEQRLRSGQRLQMPPLEQVVDHQTAPLSYAQQRLWFLQNLHPEDTSYNMPFGLKLKGPLDTGALNRAFSEIVRRHETLRTRFLAADGGAIQVVQPAREWHLPLIDLTGLEETQQQAETKALTRKEAGRIFDLASDELLHTVLLRRSPEDHLLLVTMHHIVSDGWSMGVLIKEVSVLYDAYCRGDESPLSELPVQYADYARWQREWLQGEVLDEQLKYWEEKLAGAPVQVELPTDRPKAAVKAGRAGQVRVEFDEELTRSVKQESRKQALTVYMLLMGALGVLLTRYSRSSEVLIGSPIANRAMAEVEGLIGFFVNTLALRVRVDEEETVEELLKRVRDEVLGAYAHQDVPYEKVVERVQVERAGEAGGLFQVMLAVQNAPRGEIRMEGLEIAAESVGTERAKFELTIGLGENGGRLVGGVEYNAELYEAESVRRMMRHLEELLRGVVAGEGKRVRELELMSAAERRQVLEEWNETAVEYPRVRSVAELFEEVVVSQPHAIAVAYEGEQLSYEQLNSRANQLAHYLRSRGVGPEVAVGIMLDRSLELIVGLIAILKAGGAYVPLDPQYPEPRLTFMLADSGARVVITQSKYANVIPDSAAQLVLIDEHSEQIAAQSEQDLPSSASGLNLAYIIYTSGSTGQPKGVSVEQRAVTRLVRGANYVSLGPAEVLLQYAPVSFDASTFEVWGALLNGGKLVVMRAGEVTLRELGQTLTEQAVTTLWLTSALFNQMVDEEASSLAGVRQLIAGGDVLSPAHVNKVLQLQRQGAVINGYGPTENTTFSTCEVMSGQRVEGGRGVPIGLPISNSTAYVLNERMEPVPIGVCAELYVGGEGLARGYAGRADQTAERFVPHPYAKQPGERLYRTGDEVRRRRDGKLEFIGRSDQQVKVRGFRIELGEIERVLAQHAAVEEAAVVMKQSRTGDKRLVGYVVLGADVEIGGDVNRELREHVRSALPEYMVPMAVVVLERLPVTANGKLDRAALPELDQGQDDKAVVGPRTAEEELLLDIWKQLLGVEQISIDDDFFTLGGHSLLATQVMARIRQVFQVELGLQVLFEEPTIAGLSSAIQSQLRQGQVSVKPELKRAERGAVVELSYGQQRLWFSEQMGEGSTLYNVPVGLRLRGELDVYALARTLNEIVRRHETLRTKIELIGTQPYQVIDEQVELRLAVIDHSELDQQSKAAAGERVKRQEASAGFNLSTGPVIRAKLIKQDAQDHVLLVTMHHIVSDGWSMGVLVKEVSALYEAYRRGEESPLTELPVQYADYALWQREWLRGEVLDEQLKYWEEKLAGAPVQIELPTDRPRAAFRAGGGRAGQVRVEFDEELTRSVKQESRKRALTVYMLLMGAVGVLLTRYSRSQEVVIGSPIANRVVAEVEDLIGFFVNTLAIRVKVEEEETVDELLKRVREEVLGAYAHQDVPYEKVVERVHVDRAGEGGLFQVMLVMQNAPRGEIRMEGLEIAAESAGNERAKFELTIGIGEEGGRLVGGVEYNADLYEEQSVRRMMQHLEELLRGVVAGEGKRVRELELMSAAERRQVLEEWNKTAVEYPTGKTISELFEDVVVSQPHAIAVAYEGEQLSYEQLNSRANQLAHYLRSTGVGPEVAVGIMLDRSLELVVGLVAILKAGGAYVPLDPEYPQQRLAFMMDDSRASLVITHSKYAAPLTAQGVGLVLVDEHSDQIAAQNEQNLSQSATGSNLAYIIYTSGSTGQPKGAMNTHAGIANRLHWMQATYQLTADDRVLQKTTFNFDISVWEFFWPLITGARLVVAQPGGHRDSAYLARAIREQGITTMHFVPSMLQVFLEEKEVENCRSLKRVVCSGEALPFALQERFFARLPEVELHNLYGPTEAAVDVTAWACEKESTSGVVPIGSAIANTQIYILDRHMNPVPAGVAGELHIGGIQLARGYLNRPELTAERFVPHPFSRAGGERLYRTGDLATFQAEGNIRYLGRMDHQVKVRGYRIELGEIEATLSRHPGIAECVIALKEKRQGDNQIAAYFVPKAEQVLNLSELRSFLKLRLPGYMVPAAFVSMQEMPLTPNGKIDRNSLPEPVVWTEHVGLDDGTPRSPIEEMLVQVWKEVLEVEDIRINDNFFDMGGHSLLATLLTTRLRQLFDLEFPLQSIFAAPTIAEMAAVIEKMMSGGPSQQAPPIVRVPRDTLLPLTFAQERLWFINQLEPGNPFYNIPVAMSLSGPLDVAVLRRSIREIVARHEALRTTFVSFDGEPVQVISPSIDLSLPVVDISVLDESRRVHETLRLVNEEALVPFDLSRGPLIRVSLVKVGPEEQVFLLTMHHIISDAWSMRVFIQELKLLYSTFSAGLPSSLPDLSVQYADFAHWQRQYVQGEVLEGHLDFWRRQLAGAPTLIDLPLDRERPPFQTFHGAKQTFSLSRELSQAIKKLCREEDVTLFMALLAAYNVLLYSYRPQDDIVVGTDMAIRNRPEIEPLIGFFINLIPVRTEFRGNPSYRALLAKVREATLGANLHQEVPFHKLIEELQPERDPSYAPLVQVLFVLENVPIPVMEISGVSLKPLEIESKASKFDLVMIQKEIGENIIGTLMYNTDLFDASTIEEMIDRYERLLTLITEQREIQVNDLQVLTMEAEKTVDVAPGFEDFMRAQPTMVSLSEESLINTSYFVPDSTLPLVISPAVSGLDLAEWAESNRDYIDEELLRHGGILFRGFDIDDVTKFERAALAICSELFNEYGDLPRDSVGGKVYTSTPYPAGQPIHMHNESSQMHQWPLKICFHCVTPADEGGETPIVDCRKIYQALSSDLRAQFAEKKLMYVRNFTPGIDVSWQQFFRSEDKSDVERYCRQAGIEFEWKGDDELQTRTVCPAIAIHPKTNEMVFFNQIQAHHVSCLDPAVRQSLQTIFSNEDMPRNVRFGDGSQIDDEIVDHIRSLYEEASISFAWQKGDILLLDNMLTAHGRNPFTGQRKIVVAMGEMISDEQTQPRELSLAANLQGQAGD